MDLLQNLALGFGVALSLHSATKGISATVRRRLSEPVSWRWCRAQLPEIRRGMILPRSVTNVRRRLTSL